MNKLIMIWEAETCKHLYKFTGHKGPVSVKSSHSLHRMDYVWCDSELSCWLMFILFQGLSFRRGSHDLYSASHDRSVKVWNVDENAYVETLWGVKHPIVSTVCNNADGTYGLLLCCRFGHQDAITGLDCLSRERCVTTGGRDRSVRVWKIAEESQLVFHGHEWVGPPLSYMQLHVTMSRRGWISGK